MYCYKVELEIILERILDDYKYRFAQSPKSQFNSHHTFTFTHTHPVFTAHYYRTKKFVPVCI